MKYVEAPGDLKNLEHPLVFLAGGITNCEDWQAKVRKELTGPGTPNGTLLNPRRLSFPMNNPDAAEEQILWEQQALWMSDVISIWFAGGPSVQPIVMFEFGCHMGRYCIGGGPTKLIVSVDPGYKRKQDVYLQTKAHNFSLNGSWKVVLSDSLKQHTDNIRKAVTK